MKLFALNLLESEFSICFPEQSNSMEIIDGISLGLLDIVDTNFLILAHSCGAHQTVSSKRL